MTREDLALLALSVLLFAVVLLSMSAPRREPIACRGNVAQCWEVE